MRLLKGAIVVAALALAAPAAWAHGGGHGHHHGGHKHHHDRHGWDHRHHHGHGWHGGPRYYSSSRYYYQSYPVYTAPAPAPGIHIVAPNVYIPFR